MTRQEAWEFVKSKRDRGIGYIEIQKDLTQKGFFNRSGKPITPGGVSYFYKHPPKGIAKAKSERPQMFTLPVEEPRPQLTCLIGDADQIAQALSRLGR